MSELWTIAFPILIVDVANPVLLAAVILCITTSRPYANSLALIAGHTASYTLFGVLIIYGLADIVDDLFTPILDWIQSPEPEDYILGFVLGVALIWIAVRWRKNPPDPSKKKPDAETGGIFSFFVFGAVVNFVGAPFAVPYFAFINQLMRLEDGLVLPNLLLYNLLYATPFLLVPLAYAIFGKSILGLLEKINNLVDRVSGYIMPVMFGGLGLLMVADALLYFATGEGLI